VPYPISIPTVRRAHPSPDSRRSRSPAPSRVPVITTGRFGTNFAGTPSSSSPSRDISPSSPDRLLTRHSPPQPFHLTDAKSCRDSSCSGGRDGSPDSRHLKFGMERILSDEMSPVIRRHHQGW
jgi:hypothetical protein